MRFVGGHVSISGGLPHAIGNTVKIGGNCLQIFAGSPRLWFRKPFADAEVRAFLSGVKQNNFGPVFIHALYLLNLASSNTGLLEKSTTSLVADIQNGALIHSAGVIIHIGSHLGVGFDTVKDQLVAVIQRVLGETQDCDLILENAAGQNGKIGSLSELAYLLKKANDPRLKICLDTAHLFAAGVDLRSLSAIKELTQELKDLNLLDRLVCLHLNDCASDLDSHRDLHANIGEGNIGLAGLRLFINQKELLHLPLILEVPGDNKQGPNLKNVTLARKITTLQ
ncbi:hypothetical protein COY48_02010 [Candidatus Collierbacteria bacterium CG_4_10_14_0_8_um_filter_43_86]|uniref:Xylose isomerase-like TIM barrel domain-containing protein n=1 Tax=Candidatus Collierbacteria bacterium CG_4_9_14_3_um_filter_43_16 TaxID=1974532 RepID=A0A2M8BT45_9BACT|nr:MAG: hypothetical protein COY48_02010 [Candidatus Collierbacteria bacterium CG_4_10_14_0_8_um_filter_43_86]PJB47035.1 MAG: hypothetical protein CO104_04780 [Candidatus Collierbacteria bacterium CG_4_9_14_3_um_filter_43_16]